MGNIKKLQFFLIILRYLYLFLLFVVLNTFISCDPENTYKLNSPDNNIELIITDKNNGIEMKQLYNGDTVLNKVRLGLMIDSIDMSANATIKSMEFSSHDSTWKTINGKNPEVRNHYNQVKLLCESRNFPVHKYHIYLRCYNDGFAFRYYIEKANPEEEIQINDELTKAYFAKDATFWSFRNYERVFTGPEKFSDNQTKRLETPVVVETNQSYYYGIHEAELIEYAPYEIKVDHEHFAMSVEIPATRAKGNIKTAWRAFLIGQKAGDLLESSLLLNLNEPLKIEDPPWIEPGKVLWDWRVWGYKAPDGFEYGLNTPTHKRMIDFASKNNIQHLILDADWYGHEFDEDSDPRTPAEHIDLEGTLEYAKQRDVGIILYGNHLGLQKYGLDHVLKLYSKWGAKGIKYGFMRGSPEEKVKMTREVIEVCAKHNLMVIFHDFPVPPSGQRRTFPNVMSWEFCLAQSDPHSYYPEMAVNTAFINMIAGSLDMTNGWFDLNDSHVDRHRVRFELPGTVAAEVAKLVVYYTGWMVLPDAPEEYLKKEDLFKAVRQMPAQFETFEVLSGEIGEYISVLRYGNGRYFIGTLTNRKPRDLRIDLDFLPEGKKFSANIYEDTQETNYIDNKESYGIRKAGNLDRHSSLDIKMAPGGGNLIILQEM